MRKKTQSLMMENDLPIDLTLHGVSASLLSEFAEKIVRTYYHNNLNVAIQDLMRKAVAEQAFVLSHITHLRNSLEVASDGQDS
jgi:hypothetical protein